MKRLAPSHAKAVSTSSTITRTSTEQGKSWYSTRQVVLKDGSKGQPNDSSNGCGYQSIKPFRQREPSWRNRPSFTHQADEHQVAEKPKKLSRDICTDPHKCKAVSSHTRRGCQDMVIIYDASHIYVLLLPGIISSSHMSPTA